VVPAEGNGSFQLRASQVLNFDGTLPDAPVSNRATEAPAPVREKPTGTTVAPARVDEAPPAETPANQAQQSQPDNKVTESEPAAEPGMISRIGGALLGAMKEVIGIGEHQESEKPGDTSTPAAESKSESDEGEENNSEGDRKEEAEKPEKISKNRLRKQRRAEREKQLENREIAKEHRHVLPDSEQEKKEDTKENIAPEKVAKYIAAAGKLLDQIDESKLPKLKEEHIREPAASQKFAPEPTHFAYSQQHTAGKGSQPRAVHGIMQPTSTN